MDIKEFIASVTIENWEELSNQYMEWERTRENLKGQKYSTTSFLRNISRARNEIRRSSLDEKLKKLILESKSNGKGVRASGEEWNYKEKLFTNNIHEKQRNCQFFNPLECKEIAEKYLNHTSIKYQTAALCLLTGRRPIEILWTGLFFDPAETTMQQAIDVTENHLKKLGYNKDKLNLSTEESILQSIREYHTDKEEIEKIEGGKELENYLENHMKKGNFILFSGQAKQRKDKGDNRPQPYIFPSLEIETKDIIKAINSIRSKLEIPSHLQQYEIPDYLHNRFSKEVGGAIKKIYKDVLPPTALSPSELRGIYAVSCFHLHHGYYSHMGQAVYIANILGHNPNNLKSVFSYDNYKVMDNI